MELLQLKYFCETAKNENLSETAKKFYVPPSNISNAIKRLETELGCSLFDHLSNKIILNDKGRAFYEKVQTALFLIGEAREELNDDTSLMKGEINLCCKSQRRAVASAIEKFAARHPNVKFRTVFGDTDAKDIDLIISYDLPISYKERVFILEEDIPIAMTKSHPLAKKEPLMIEDLKDERFIAGLSAITARACEQAGFRPNIAFLLNDPFYVRKYVEAGLGIAFVPAYSWRGDFSENIILRSVGIKRKTYAYTPAERHTKRAVELFIEFLLDETKDAR